MASRESGRARGRAEPRSGSQRTVDRQIITLFEQTRSPVYVESYWRGERVSLVYNGLVGEVRAINWKLSPKSIFRVSAEHKMTYEEYFLFRYKKFLKNDSPFLTVEVSRPDGTRALLDVPSELCKRAPA